MIKRFLEEDNNFKDFLLLKLRHYFLFTHPNVNR